MQEKLNISIDKLPENDIVMTDGSLELVQNLKEALNQGDNAPLLHTPEVMLNPSNEEQKVSH